MSSQLDKENGIFLKMNQIDRFITNTCFYCSKLTLWLTGFNGEFKINNLLCMNVEMNVMDE